MKCSTTDVILPITSERTTKLFWSCNFERKLWHDVTSIKSHHVNFLFEVGLFYLMATSALQNCENDSPLRHDGFGVYTHSICFWELLSGLLTVSMLLLFFSSSPLCMCVGGPAYSVCILVCWVGAGSLGFLFQHHFQTSLHFFFHLKQYSAVSQAFFMISQFSVCPVTVVYCTLCITCHENILFLWLHQLNHRSWQSY